MGSDIPSKGAINMRCPKCNAQIEKDDVFCPVCGIRLDHIEKSHFPAILISLAIVIIISVGVVGWVMTGNSKPADTYDSSYVESEEKGKANTPQKDESAAKNTEATEETKETGIEKSGENQVAEKSINERSETKQPEASDYSKSDYILPESNAKYLTDADIKGLSIRCLNYAKNEIYARHGRKFDSNELQTYFNSKSWYQGKYEPADFDTNYNPKVLSDIEKKNAEFLKNAEYRLSPTGYELDK